MFRYYQEEGKLALDYDISRDKLGEEETDSEEVTTERDSGSKWEDSNFIAYLNNLLSDSDPETSMKYLFFNLMERKSFEAVFG